MIPDDLVYTAEHEWVRGTGPVRVGVTDYAQDALGDIVYVSLPDVGTSVTAGESVGELESTKSVSDVYCPVTGTVTARNDALVDGPEAVNDDPYGSGWLFEVEIDSSAQLEGLLSAAEYQEAISE